jgi:hypothetical protein
MAEDAQSLFNELLELEAEKKQLVTNLAASLKTETECLQSLRAQKAELLLATVIRFGGAKYTAAAEAVHAAAGNPSATTGFAADDLQAWKALFAEKASLSAQTSGLRAGLRELQAELAAVVERAEVDASPLGKRAAPDSPVTPSPVPLKAAAAAAAGSSSSHRHDARASSGGSSAQQQQQQQQQQQLGI